MHGCVPTYICTQIHTCINAYIQIHFCLPTYIPKCICVACIHNDPGISWDSSVGRGTDLHTRGPGFNTWPGLTHPSIPLWVGKMSTQQT